MLADTTVPESAGRLDEEVHLAETAKHRLIEFIANHLPVWRDHAGRPPRESESELTNQLCSFLTSVARLSDGWNHFQFTTEAVDEVQRGRRLDLAPMPCGVTLFVGRQRHTIYQILFPIECKRLPTPISTTRDEREYVVTRIHTTGGIQRFKFGFHGAAHSLAAMIAYVQDGTTTSWLASINGWIQDLAIEAGSKWTSADDLTLIDESDSLGVSRLVSSHDRSDPLQPIEIRHLWVRMGAENDERR